MYNELKHKFEFYDKKKALEIEMGQTESAGEKEPTNQSENEDPVLTNRKNFKFYFYGDYSDSAKSIFQQAQINDLKQICQFLKFSVGDLPTIKYKIFDSRENKQKNDPYHSPSRASSRFKEMAVYRVWHEGEDEHLPHELTHLVAHHFDKPYLFQADVDGKNGETERIITEMVSTSFWQEGLAHAVDELIFSKKPIGIDKYFVDEWCRREIDNIPHLQDCVNFDGFNKHPHELVVPFAGSLTKHLIKNFGVDKFRELYIRSQELYSPKKNVTILESLYGSDILDNWCHYIKTK